LLLSQNVQEIEEVFSHLDQEIGKFQEWSALGCKAGCGKCCFKPDIEATALEFLPFAHHLFEHGQPLEWLETFRQNPTAICQLFKPTGVGKGSCSEYPYRGLICRLFGFSARTNKYGRKELVTCQVIKTEQAEAFSGAEKQIDDGASVPVMNHYYMRLHAIDPDLARDYYPINEAIKRAIETVLHYYAYRN
jgi:Fe-S-cluster containining protein